MFKIIKLHANGNNFVFFFKKIKYFNLKKHINKKIGIYSDQIFFINKIYFLNNTIKIKILNCDFSIALNCGNGIRSLASFFLKNSIKYKILKILINKNYIFSWKYDNNITYTMFEKPKIKNTFLIRIENVFLQIGIVSLINLHTIIIVKNIKSFNIVYFKNKIDVIFKKKINIEFIQVLNRNKIYLRVFEKGVGETYSCGSGIMCSIYYIKNKVHIKKTQLVKTIGGYCNVACGKNNVLIYGNVNICFFGFI